MSADQELALTGATGALAAVAGVGALAIAGGVTLMKKMGAKAAAKADETPTNETE